MRVKKVLYSAGLTGFYVDDKEAIREGAEMDGFIYRGTPLTHGFKTIRQAGESVSVILVLENGEIAYGDCAVAQYSGSGGRETPNNAAALIDVLQKYVTPFLEGRTLTNFKKDAEELDNIMAGENKLPASVRYGATQAILEAVAKERKLTMTEVVAEDYGLELELVPVLLNAQSGDDRYINVDKMILKKAGMIPHGLINNVDEKLGRQGEKFLEYVRWVKERVMDIGENDYKPIFRYDVYGTIGKAFNNKLEAVADYLVRVGEIAAPYEIMVEMPVDMGSKEAQLEAMLELRRKLDEKGSKLLLVIDEYANTLEEIREWVDARGADMIQVKTIDLGGINNIVEANLYCKKHNIRAYQGGTCNETDKSARVCVHLALATQPFAMASKPGMGVDEGMMIVKNEMERTLTVLKAKKDGLF